LSVNFRGKGGRPPMTVGVRKLESLDYHMALFAWSYVSSFDTIPSCDTRWWLLPAHR